jgi:mono/diheme cytochrome c family protein
VNSTARIVIYVAVLAAAGGGVLAYPTASRWWAARSMPPAANREVAYVADVAPILETHCYECHGDGRGKGRFNVETREALMDGGKTGPAIADGDSAASTLIHRVAGVGPGKIMPPSDKTPLTPAQIGILRAWIDQGTLWGTAE